MLRDTIWVRVWDPLWEYDTVMAVLRGLVWADVWVNGLYDKGSNRVSIKAPIGCRIWAGFGVGYGTFIGCH